MSNESSQPECPCCKALWVKFYLTEELTTTKKMARAKVFVDEQQERQFWQGEDPDPDNKGICVYNLESKSPFAGQYRFSGKVNDVGIAALDDTKPECDRYRIVAFTSGTATPLGSATTTTLSPACTGECKWTWNAASNSWSLTTDGCATTTTTTTTTSAPTTTSGPTTTTFDPCACGAGTTTTAAPTTTTTTPTPSCECTYPRFCGQSDGDCTYTHCTTGEVAPAPIDCTTTTTTTTTTTSTTEPTTTTTSTTTTTCDCNTTTTSTAPPGCTQGCDWIWIPNALGQWRWQITSNGCASHCPCPPPTEPGSECGTTHTECVTTTTTTVVPPSPSCEGDCIYWWIQDRWVLTVGRCSYSIVPCSCSPPSEPGTSGQCYPLRQPCETPPSNTTTTTTTTTAAPCAHCYTTTSTTTTAHPCTKDCTWRWSVAGNSWSLVDNPCLDSCSCSRPPRNGHLDCELAQSPCQLGATTTTSDPGSSTTTTTPAPCCGGMAYMPESLYVTVRCAFGDLLVGFRIDKQWYTPPDRYEYLGYPTPYDSVAVFCLQGYVYVAITLGGIDTFLTVQSCAPYRATGYYGSCSIEVYQ